MKREKPIDVEGMISIFGSPEMLSLSLKTNELATVEPVAIRRWMERGRIPGHHLVALTVLADRVGLKLQPQKFWNAK